MFAFCWDMCCRQLSVGGMFNIKNIIITFSFFFIPSLYPLVTQAKYLFDKSKYLNTGQLAMPLAVMKICVIVFFNILRNFGKKRFFLFPYSDIVIVFSSYHILCYKFCTWKGGGASQDCGVQSDWGRTRRHVGVSTTNNNSVTDVSHLAGMLSMLQTWRPPATPPPPYEPPPSYSLAVFMADNDAYIVSEPVLVWSRPRSYLLTSSFLIKQNF